MLVNVLGLLVGLGIAGSWFAITSYVTWHANFRVDARKKIFRLNLLLVAVCAYAGWFHMGPNLFGER